MSAGEPRESRSFDALGVIRGQSVNLTGGDQPERVIGSFVTADVFRMLQFDPQPPPAPSAATPGVSTDADLVLKRKPEKGVQ